MLVALEIRQFRWLLGSNIAFFLAMQGQVLTRTFLAWDLTGEEMSLAYINLAFAIPMLLFSLIGGAVSDRIERRKLILTGQCLLIACELAILALLATDSLQFWHLITAGAFSGTVIPFLMPSRAALVYNVVGPAKLGNAIALNSGVMNFARVLGPAMMGFVLDLWSAVGAYAIASALFTVSMLSMLTIERQPLHPPQQKHLVADMVAGFRYIAGYRPLLVCLLFGMVPMFLAMPFQNLLVLFADEVWMMGERGLGILMATAGLGGTIGSLWVARAAGNNNRLMKSVVAALLFGCLLVVFSLSPGFYLALIPLVLANAFASASQTLNNTMSQLLVEDAYRGRMASFMMMTFGLTPLGVLPLAFLAQTTGPRTALTLAAVTMIVVVVLFYLGSRTLRSLDEDVRKTLSNAGDGKRSDVTIR